MKNNGTIKISRSGLDIISFDVFRDNDALHLVCHFEYKIEDLLHNLEILGFKLNEK